MNLSDPIDRAERAAADALHAMARLRVAPTPNNYLIWYSHCTRRYPDLSRALQAMEAAGEPFTEVDCAEIFERFFGIGREVRLIDDGCMRITQVMTELLGQVGAVEQNTSEYGDALTSFNASLTRSIRGTMSEGLRRMLEVVARACGWLLVVMAAVTCFDVLARKTGLPVPLTRLQELERHFHGAIFSLWMGYGYTINAHPRVDSFTERLTLRHKAWIELAGCLLLALPYMALVAYQWVSPTELGDCSCIA